MRKFTENVRRFTNWCSRHKIISAFAVAVLLLSIPLHFSHAATGDLFMKFLANPFDATLLTLAGIIQVITGAIGKLVLLLIQVVVIPVLGYNGFYNSHITNLGWSLVRDVVNMFVVVVLMVIAIMTIVGYSAANWTQQLPKLFIAIVLVNFSKLICGFLIDVSQVIMFTFVNAIVSIAAGNFASMFSLNQYGQFSADFIDRVNESGNGTEAFQFLIAAYLQFIVLLGILGVMFLLAAAFVWRIVVLWILIIMSPLAFFMIGVKDVFHAADSTYKKWWEKFTSALTFGPTMVFFLWLALAAASGSNLAQTEDFPMPDAQNSADIPLKMFDMNNFLGLLLAVAILMAGMQQASASAAGIGGFASKLLSEDMGKGLLKGIARPFNSAKRLGKGALTGGKIAGMEVPGLAKIAPGYTQKFGKGLANAGTGLSKALGGGVVASMVGGTLASAGAFASHEGKEVRKARNKEGADDASHMTDDQKTAYNLARADVMSGDANRVKRGQGVLAQFGSGVHGAKAKDLVTSEPSQKRLRKDLEDSYKGRINSATGVAYTDAEVKALATTDFDNTMSEQLRVASTPEGKEFLQLSQAEKDSIEDTKTANLHLITPEDGETREQAITKHLNKMKDAGRLKSGAISAAAIKSSGPNGDAVRAAMKGFEYEVGKDGKAVKLWDKMAVEGTDDQKKAIAATVTPAQINQYSVPAATDEEKKRAAQDVSTMVTTDRIPRTAAAGPLSAADKTLFDSVRDNLGAMGRDGRLTPQMQGKATAQLMEAGYTAPDVLGVPAGGYPAATDAAASGAVDTKLAGLANKDEVFERIDNVLEADASNAALFDELVPQAADLSQNVGDPVKTSEVTKRIANVSASDVDSLYKVDPNASPQTIARKKQALSTIDRAVSAQLHAEDQKAQAAERLRKTQQDAKAATAALALAAANQAASVAENTAAATAKTAADAAVAAKAPTNTAAQNAAIDQAAATAHQRAATAAAELTRATAFATAAAATEAAALAFIPGAQADVARLGKENKEEMKRLSKIHAKIKNTAITTSRYTPT